MTDLDDLIASCGGRHALDAIALTAIAANMNHRRISEPIVGKDRTWLVEGELSQIAPGIIHLLWRTAQIENSLIPGTVTVVGVEADITARLLGTVTSTDPVTDVHHPNRWNVDTPLSLYLGGAITLDPTTTTVVATALAIQELEIFWDLTVTGIEHLVDWPTFVAYLPPWATCRGGAGHPPEAAT